MNDDGSTWRVVSIPAGQREPYRDLMRLADDSASRIEEYLDQGVLYALLGADGAPVGQVLAVPGPSSDELELVSVSVVERHQGQGLGRRLMVEVLERLRHGGGRRVLVSTATSSLNAIGFYLRLGFRMLRIERDAFGPEHGYPADLVENGIPVRDRVWLDRPLDP